MSGPPPPPAQGPPLGLRPVPGRSATLSSYGSFPKIRAASQPAGERIPIPSSSNPDSGRGSPGMNGGIGSIGGPSTAGVAAGNAGGGGGGAYGVIGGSRASQAGPGRFPGALGGGTATRANSFSVAELRERHAGLSRTLSSHAEEHSSRSRSGSPYPTFSPSSSPDASPRMSGANGGKLPAEGGRGVPHSPPRAEANISRSRSQSLAAGAVRPDMRPFGMTMSTMDSSSGGSGMGTGGFGRTFDRGWNISPEEGNMSPFSRHQPMFGGPAESPRWAASQAPEAQTASGLGQSPAYSRFRASQQDYIGSNWGSSAPESTQALTRSVAKALAGGPGAGTASSGATTGTQGSYNTQIGGFEQHNGGRSGSSSRRHSVSVVGGPGGRRDFLFGEGGGMSTITSRPGRGLGAYAFTDEELLPEKLNNALNLEIDESRRRGYDIEVKSPGGRDIPRAPASQGSSLPGYAPAQSPIHARSSMLGYSPALPIGGAPSRNKDPFAPEYGFGTSPARGRLETLQASTERARSGDSKSGSSPARSRFSFDQPGQSGSPTGINAPRATGGIASNGSSLLGQGASGSGERARSQYLHGDIGVQGGPGAIGGPAGTPFDSRSASQSTFNPFPSGLGQQAPSSLGGYRPYGGQVTSPGGALPSVGGYGQTQQAYGRQQFANPYFAGAGPGSRGPGDSIGPLGMGYGGGPGQGGYVSGANMPYGQQPQNYYAGAPAQVGLGGPVPPSPSSFSSLSLSDLGRGLPLTGLSPTTPLYIVAFKAGRRDVFYCPDPTLLISNGDKVIVEGDRGSDLGTVVYDQLTPVQVREWQEKQATAALLSGAREHQPPGVAMQEQQQQQQQKLGRSASFRQGTGASAPNGTASGELASADLHTLLSGVGPSGIMDSGAVAVRGPLAKEIMPKRIFAKSSQGPEDQARIMEKLRDEHDAMMMCREKVAQRGLPMQIVDAEYQWDRRKLTFYFKADKRVDFRDLTKDLFRMVKSRIWMSMVPKDDPRQG